MEVSLTIFKNKYDTDTSKRMDFVNFDEFEKLLYLLSQQPKMKKEDASLISPATFLPETTRKNVNVVDWGGWAALDVDDWHPEGELVNDITNKFSDYRFVCYSTASSTHAHPKFRLVFGLNKRIDSDQIRPLWYSLNEMAGLLGDKQVKDLSRMYYVPASYNTSRDSFQFIFSNRAGALVDPAALIEKYPVPIKEGNTFFERLPEALQNQIIEHRKSQAQNTTFSWTGIKDCPFWSKKLQAEYVAITGTGWYHQLYKIMSFVAYSAVKNKYPITPKEIADLCHELHTSVRGGRSTRNLEKESERSIEYAYRSM